jgi:hypothetical protein
MVKFRETPVRDHLKTNSISANANSPSDRGKRRGVRVNSRVPIALEWIAAGEIRSREAQTRVVGPYGCLAVLKQSLDVDQKIQVTNLVSRRANPAVVVWRGLERTEGWELGIELINPEMGFWGLEL